MTEEFTLATTKVSTKLSIPGYVLDKEILTRVDEICVQAVSGRNGEEQGRSVETS